MKTLTALLLFSALAINVPSALAQTAASALEARHAAYRLDVLGDEDAQAAQVAELQALFDEPTGWRAQAFVEDLWHGGKLRKGKHDQVLWATPSRKLAKAYGRPVAVAMRPGIMVLDASAALSTMPNRPEAMRFYKWVIAEAAQAAGYGAVFFGEIDDRRLMDDAPLVAPVFALMPGAWKRPAPDVIGHDHTAAGDWHVNGAGESGAAKIRRNNRNRSANQE